MASSSHHRPHFSKHPATNQVPQTTAENTRKSQVFLGLSLMSLTAVLLLKWVPALAMTLPLFGISAVGYWLWTEFQREQQQKQKRQTQVEGTFHRLLQTHRGHINVLEFAMQAQLSLSAAQNYLNRQAQTLSAYVATDSTALKASNQPASSLTYVFDLTANTASLNHHRHQYISLRAEATWAAAEQARYEATKRNQAQAAWANAKQIRSLHQLSQADRFESKPEIKPMSDRDSADSSCAGSVLTQSAQPLFSQPSCQESSPIQAGYIAISTIDSQGNEKSSYPVGHHNTTNKTVATRPETTKTLAAKAITIDISAG